MFSSKRPSLENSPIKVRRYLVKIRLFFLLFFIRLFSVVAWKCVWHLKVEKKTKNKERDKNVTQSFKHDATKDLQNVGSKIHFDLSRPEPLETFWR